MFTARLCGHAVLLLTAFTSAKVAGGDDATLDQPDLGPASLSVCRLSPAERKIQSGTRPANLEEFAARLHGTWKLATRTIQGVTIDTHSKFYFNLKTITPYGASGSAMMIDRGNLRQLDPMAACKECLADASVGAYWKVSISRKGGAAFLSMAGEYRGSYGEFVKGITATEESTFLRVGENYMGGNLVSPAGGPEYPDDTWDSIGLSSNVLTYVSCKNGFVDRFEKISDQTPTVDGRTLEEEWALRKKDGSLVRPPHVEADKQILR
jgi:hypothetical protein